MGEVGNWVNSQYYERHRRGGKRLASNPATERLGALERMHMKTFTEMAMNRFQWINLPPSIDARFLERTLLFNALSVFFVDDNLGPLALRGHGVGPINMYDNFTKFRTYGPKFIARTMNSYDRYEIDPETKELMRLPAECVPIWANYERTPDLDYIMIYASKLADIDRTIEINAHNSRYTTLVASSESQKLSFANVKRQMDEGSSAIFVDESFEPDKINSIDLGLPVEIHTTLPVLRTRYYSEAVGLFGINNSNQDKKERLVADEVSANDEQVGVMRDIALKARQEACNQINAAFGLDIWCEFGSVIDQIIKENNASEGDSDGSDNTNA